MLYNALLVSAVQLKSVIATYISLPLWASFPLHQPPAHSTPLVVTECWARLPVLYSSFPLAIYFTHGNVYIYQCYFLNSSHALILPLCLQDQPPCLNLYFLLKSMVSERTFSFAGSKECRSISPVFPDSVPEKWRTRPQWLPATPANKTPPKGPFPGVQMISSA